LNKPGELASKPAVVSGHGYSQEALSTLAEILASTLLRMQREGEFPLTPVLVAPDPLPLPAPSTSSNEPIALWTAKRVATYCSVSPRTVTRWRKRGDLHAAGRRPDGRWLFDPRDVKAMLGVKERPPEPPSLAPGPHQPVAPSGSPQRWPDPDPRDPSRPIACHLVDCARRVLNKVDDFSNKLRRWVEQNRGKRLTTGVIKVSLMRTYSDVARSNIRGTALSADLKRLSEWLGIKVEKGKKGRVWVL